jgi:NAD(P)H-hydrate epimerase
MQDLRHELYTVNSVVELEQIAIKQFDIPAYELMLRAGQAAFDLLLQRFSTSRNILVLCGAGNNAGDGYVVARLAKQACLNVQVISLIDPDSLKNEAGLAYRAWLEACDESDRVTEHDITSAPILIKECGVIIDALLGTGLQRSISDQWSDLIDLVNHSGKPVISVDIPSGLYADTGCIAGNAIKADITVSFIGFKQGMFTAQAGDVCGEIILHDLDLPEQAYEMVSSDAMLITSPDYDLLPERKAASHKGRFGHVLIVGGNKGMPGAVILAARAALRCGAGLVTIVTEKSNLPAIAEAVPEAMVKTYPVGDDDVFPETLTDSVTHIAVGMGLGQDEWASALLKHCISMNKPMLIDADGLNLLASSLQLKETISTPLVITPHPGEAARLLSGTVTETKEAVSSADIQKDRFSSIRKLRAWFDDVKSCTVVLKGSGSLVYDGQLLLVCNQGSAAMAAPGMGDVLSGICIGLMAQLMRPSSDEGEGEVSLSEITALAVCLHAGAADRYTKGKTRGLLASDVIDTLPELLR